MSSEYISLSERQSADKQIAHFSHHFEWGSQVWWMGLIADLLMKEDGSGITNQVLHVPIWSIMIHQVKLIREYHSFLSVLSFFGARVKLITGAHLGFNPPDSLTWNYVFVLDCTPSVFTFYRCDSVSLLRVHDRLSMTSTQNCFLSGQGHNKSRSIALTQPCQHKFDGSIFFIVGCRPVLCFLCWWNVVLHNLIAYWLPWTSVL